RAHARRRLAAQASRRPRVPICGAGAALVRLRRVSRPQGAADEGVHGQGHPGRRSAAERLTAILALSAAFGFGVAGVFLKRALQYVNPLPAAVLSVTFTTAVVWGVTLSTTSLDGLVTPRILPFVVAGVLAPGLSRLALFTGIARVGVARTYAIGATAPLVSVVLAIVFLGEPPSWLLLLRTGLVGGGALRSARPPGDRSWRRRDLVFAGLAALGFALRDNVTRYGFREFADPVLAAAVSTATSVTIMWTYATLAARRELRFERPGL